MGRFSECDNECDEYSHLAWARYEHNLKRAIAGKKGQRLLRELRDALLALPERRLIDNDLATPAGEVCLIGALVVHKTAEASGVPIAEAAKALAAEDPEPWDDYERDDETGRWEKTVMSPWSGPYQQRHGDLGDADYTVDAAMSVGMTKTMVWELGSQNDDVWGRLTPELRWEKALAWVTARIVAESVGA